MARTSTQLVGAAGEFFVAAELSRRGWAAGITPRGAPNTDVVAHHLTTGRAVALQVKTATGRSRFRLRQRHEQGAASDPDWFVLVRISDDFEARPDFYIVPTTIVAAYVYVSHRVWSARAAERAGAPRGEHDMRQIDPADVMDYRDRWDLLDRPAEKAPEMLPEWIVDAARGGVGLPDSHPGLRAPVNISIRDRDARRDQDDGRRRQRQGPRAR
jgi:hypothetical protein